MKAFIQEKKSKVGHSVCPCVCVCVERTKHTFKWFDLFLVNQITKLEKEGRKTSTAIQGDLTLGSVPSVNMLPG